MVVYLGAVAFGGIMILKDMGEQKQAAQKEFDKLVVYTQNLNLDFMSEPFQSAFGKTLALSKPLSAVIVSNGISDYTFENVRDAAIKWDGRKPSFKKSFLLSTEELVSPLSIANQRNVTIRAVYDRIDYAVATVTLKQSLLVVLLALCVSFFAFLLRLLLSRDTISLETRADNVLTKQGNVIANAAGTDDSFDDDPDEEISPYDADYAGSSSADNGTIIMPELSEAELSGLMAEGPDTPFLGIGDELDLTEKLTDELARSLTFNQDLTVMAMESKKKHFAEDVVDFFVLKDIIFETTPGEGDAKCRIDVIAPATTIDEGFHKASDFYKAFLEKYPEQEVFIGLSSRSGRDKINAERLLLEAENALWNSEKDSPIVAFRVDPEKYEKWLKSKETE
jgi:hypothetical protein